MYNSHCDNSLFRPNTVYTFQALSEEDLELWLDGLRKTILKACRRAKEADKGRRLQPMARANVRPCRLLERGPHILYVGVADRRLHLPALRAARILTERGTSVIQFQ